MKKIVSVREFKEYCEKNKPQSTLFYSENQDWYDLSDPCILKISFPTILIFENPNVIYLKSRESCIAINRVKFIEIDTDFSSLETIYTVFCGKFKTNDYDITYTLLAR